MSDKTKKGPTTAELFATAKDGTAHDAGCMSTVGLLCDCYRPARIAALSELERRMGAMERALNVLGLCDVPAVDGVSIAGSMAAYARSALTGAPPASPVEAVAQRAAAELRHAYKAQQDWNLVARAIALLEGVTTPGSATPVFTLEEVEGVIHAYVRPEVVREALSYLAALRR